jgi:endonuclease YncB( thermonuclease family)
MRTTIAVILLLLATQAQAEMGKVVGVTDGDTIKVILHGVQTDVRLYGVDCPEKKQAFGQAARDFTAGLVAGQEVDVEPMASDRYGRTVAMVTIGDQSLQENLLAAGYAWVYGDYCKKPFCNSWLALQEIAVAGHEGLWGDAKPVAPWDWRKGH